MKKLRSLEELKTHRDHYLSIVYGLKPEAVTILWKQINKLNTQIRALQAQGRTEP